VVTRCWLRPVERRSRTIFPVTRPRPGGAFTLIVKRLGGAVVDERPEDKPHDADPDEVVANAAAPPADPGRPDPGRAELNDAAWQHRAAEFLDTGFLAMVRRLPVLIGQAMALAWRAGPRDTALSVGLNLGSGLLTAFGLLATRGVFAALFAAGPTSHRVTQAIPSLLVVGVTAAVRSALQIGAGWAQARLEPKVTRLVERTLYDVTSQVELAAFDDTGFADELERARDRGSRSTEWMVTHTIDLLTALVGLAGAALALVVLHPLLLVALVASAVPRGWASVRAARIGYDSMFRRIARRRRLGLLGDLMADPHTAEELRAYTMRGFLLAEYDRAIGEETADELVVARKQAGARLVGGMLGGIATAGMYVVLALLLTSHAVPLAAAGTAIVALQSAGPALGQVVYQTNFLYEEGLYFRDYTEFMLRAALRIPPRGGRAEVPTFRTIHLRDVTLRYADTPRAALEAVSLTVERGQTVLVGENGSGKSTLARVLAGLYRPSSGTVRWDDVDLATIDPEVARGGIAFVTQEYHRWPFTARQNVRLGRHARADGDEPVYAAAQAGGAHEMIEKLPFGYETLLDRTFRDGHELSGGQWQRIAAARGFYRDAPLLICDEPSAALDARAEHALFQRLREHAASRTTILITHRLANIRHADQIYVLHDGRLVEQGTHDQLIAAAGRYAELFTIQAAGYRIPDQRI
jgi:ABC-type multidrug transport system fused ATPase/permease subunit